MENYRTVTEIRLKEFEYEWRIDSSSEKGIYTSPIFEFELAGDCTKWRIRIQFIKNGKQSYFLESGRNSMICLSNYDAKVAIELVDTKHPKITLDAEFRLLDSESKDLTKSVHIKDQAFKGKILESNSIIQLSYKVVKVVDYYGGSKEISPGLGKMKLVCNLKAAVEKNEPPKSSIINDLAELTVNGDFSDITISVREREFHAHKIILAARSKVFSSMFKNEMKEAISGKLEIEDMEPESFDEFLKFIYTGHFHDEERACDLLGAADKYDVQDLKALCEDVIIKSINIENFFKILALSERHSAKKLKKETIKFIASEVPLDNIHELAEFKDPSLLMEIIEEFTKQRLKTRSSV